MLVYVTIGKEGHAWEAEVLMINEHLDGRQVGITAVIDESCHVPVVACVHTVQRLLVLMMQATIASNENHVSVLLLWINKRKRRFTNQLTRWSKSNR